VASDDPTVGEAPSRQASAGTQQQRPVVAPAKLNMPEGSLLATLTVRIDALLELFPCAAALWSADRSQCVFNSAMETLASYPEDDFCADEALWLRCIDPRDREVFLSSWKTLQKGQAKISCRYRFTPPGRLSIDIEETAVAVLLGPTGTSAVLSLYQTKAGIRRARRDDAAIQGLVHHMGNSLQAIRGEVDLLHLTGALPQRSFDNITRGIEQLNDLLGEIDGLPRVEPLSLVHGGPPVAAIAERAWRKIS
jgi:PAS domain-containing protein